MLFTSLLFLIFFLVVFSLYWFLPAGFRIPLLIVSSLFFYYTWSPLFLVHFLFLISINHFFNRQIVPGGSYVPLSISLLFNFANLFFFKYFYFALNILADLFGQQALESSILNRWLHEHTPWDSIILPLAISFYTFEFTAYTIDIYRDRVKNRFSFSEFTVFIAFFPKLIAGPIMRYEEFAGQMRSIKNLRANPELIHTGMMLIWMGLAKKLLVADNLAPHTANVFQHYSNYGSAASFMATLAFSAQLFCDFSGYTDIARGLSRLLGFEIPENFRAPYFSTSVRSLWSNWHRTLTFWLRDYVYIPLGGNRVSAIRSGWNMIFTMTLCGIWHGASYNFLLLGFYHGLLIAIEELAPISILPFINKLSVRIVRSAIVFVFLNLGFVLFNTAGMHEATGMFVHMFTFREGPMPGQGFTTLVILSSVGTLLFHLQQLHNRWFEEKVKGLPSVVYGSGAFVLFLLTVFAGAGRDFFYFQF